MAKRKHSFLDNYNFSDRKVDIDVVINGKARKIINVHMLDNKPRSFELYEQKGMTEMVLSFNDGYAECMEAYNKFIG